MEDRWTIDTLEASYSIENPAIPTSVADDYLTSGGSPTSDAGIYIHRPEVALGVSAVWQAVSMISSDVAKLPLVLYERGEDDTRERVRDHPAAIAVRKETSRGVTAFKFWRRMMVHLLLWNRAYAWIRTEGGRMSLVPLLPDSVSVWHHDGETFYNAYSEEHQVTLFPEEVIHLEGLSVDCYDGEIFLEHARDTIGLALAQQRFSSAFFRRGGRIGGILELPAAMTTRAKDSMEQGFRKSYEAFDAAFKTVILRDNAKFHGGQFSPEDAQLTEGRREQVREVARRFNLRPSKLGEETSASYASKAEDNRAYLDETLASHLCQIAEECSLKLLSVEEYQSDQFYFEHNTDRLLALNPLERAQQYDYLRRNNIISPNEARKRENMPLREDPGGDKYDNPNTTATEPKPPEKSSKATKAHRKLLHDTLQRTLSIAVDKAVRACDQGNKFPQWIETRLAGVVLAVTDAIQPVVEAHAAVTDRSAADLTALAHARIQRELVAILDECCNRSSAEMLRNTVADATGDFAERMATTIANLITE